MESFVTSVNWAQVLTPMTAAMANVTATVAKTALRRARAMSVRPRAAAVTPMTAAAPAVGETSPKRTKTAWNAIVMVAGTAATNAIVRAPASRGSRPSGCLRTTREKLVRATAAANAAAGTSAMSHSVFS